MERKLLLLSAVVLLAGIGTYNLVNDLFGDVNGGNRPVTRVELDRKPGQNVYDVVQELRPGWIQEYRPGAGQVAYIEMACTKITCLRWVEADNVEQVVFVGPKTESPTWLGLEKGTEAGTLVVKLRTRKGS